MKHTNYLFNLAMVLSLFLSACGAMQVNVTGYMPQTALAAEVLASSDVWGRADLLRSVLEAAGGSPTTAIITKAGKFANEYGFIFPWKDGYGLMIVDASTKELSKSWLSMAKVTTIKGPSPFATMLQLVKSDGWRSITSNQLPANVTDALANTGWLVQLITSMRAGSIPLLMVVPVMPGTIFEATPAVQ